MYVHIVKHHCKLRTYVWKIQLKGTCQEINTAQGEVEIPPSAVHNELRQSFNC